MAVKNRQLDGQLGLAAFLPDVPGRRIKRAGFLVTTLPAAVIATLRSPEARRRCRLKHGRVGHRDAVELLGK
jgi:hypothetical protein